MQISVAGATYVETHSPVDSVLSAFMSIGRLMRQRIHTDDLEPGTFWLLKNLAAQGSMRVTDLAACTNLDTSTVSRHVTQLQRLGLIERTPDPDDGRAQRVELSHLGREQLNNSLVRRRALLTKSLSRWNLEDIAQLDRLLARFVNDIENLNTNLENA
jgi:DNA-binding MarR family transcriptional regulator